MFDKLKKYLNEDQDPKAVEKVLEKLQHLLRSGEEIEYIAVQKKPAVNLSPESIALTNKRVIFCRPKNLGFSIDIQEYPLTDLSDVQFKEGLLGSEFNIKTQNGLTEKIDYLPKVQARIFYTKCQDIREKMKEIKIEKTLEPPKEEFIDEIEKPEDQNDNQMAANVQDEVFLALQKLKNLYDNQLINRDEFEAKKAEILSRL